jgi:hypothetical protein
VNRSRLRAIGALSLVALFLWGTRVAAGPQRTQAIFRWLARASIALSPLPHGNRFGGGRAGTP